MAKIQITDDADAKKQSLAENAAKKSVNVSSSKKHSKKVSVDATSVTPKKVKKIKVEKTENKAPKKASKKSVKIEKTEPKKAEITVKKSSPKPERSKKTIKHESSKSAVSSNATHNILQKSTTLSRRYVKRPENEAVASNTEKTDNPRNAESATPITVNKVAVSRAQAKKARHAEKLARAQAKLAEKRARAEAEAARKAKAKAERLAAIETAKAQKAAAARAAREQKEAAARAAREAKLAKKQAKAAMPSLKTAEPKNHALIDKDKAIKNAMRSVATMNATETPAEMHREFRKKKKGGRIALALLCSAVTVGALVAFVHFNMPDISVKVAAMQTGIDASYPNIVPRGYTLSNVSSDKDGEIAMVFNNSEGSSFTLTEEKSTWDSNALLNNFVKKNMSTDYSTMREQGITIYTEGDLSAWVNGGILFKVKTSGKFLTKEQIRNLATSI